MKVIVDGNPQYISQLLVIMAWMQNCKHRNSISEFKVRIDNTDAKMDLQFTFDNLDLQQQYEAFLKTFMQYNTTKVNPIFYIGNKFKSNIKKEGI